MTEPRGQLCRGPDRAAGDDFGEDAPGRLGRRKRDLQDQGGQCRCSERLVVQHGAVLLDGDRSADHHHHRCAARTGPRTTDQLGPPGGLLLEQLLTRTEERRGPDIPDPPPLLTNCDGTWWC